MQQSQDTSTHPNPLNWKDAVLFIASFVYIYLHLFQFPYTPIYFEGDHLLALSNALRLLDGEVMYRDFFHFTPPGTELYYVVLFSIFGVKMWVVDLTIVALGMAQIWLIWFFARRIFSGLYIYLPAVVFLAVGFHVLGPDGSNRLFSVVFVLAGVAVLFNVRSIPNLALAGALCGLSSFFVQPRGLLGIVGIAIFLLWENYQYGFNLRALVREIFCLSFAFGLVIFATQIYFVWQTGFSTYYFDMVTFILNNYRHDPMNNLAAYFGDLPNFGKYLEVLSPPAAVFRFIRAWIPLFFYYVIIPLVYFVFLFVVWKRKKDQISYEQKARLMLLCMVGLALAAGVSAPTAFRLFQVAIPGIIIFVWLVQQYNFSRKFVPASFLAMILLIFAYAAQRQLVTKYYMDLPVGRSAFLSAEVLAKYEWVKEHTHNGEVFYETHHPSFYFPFNLKNPTPIYLVRDSEYTPYFQIESIVHALENDPPNLIVWEGSYSKDAASRLPGDNVELLWEYISKNYEMKAEFRSFGEYNLGSERDAQMWERKK